MELEKRWGEEETCCLRPVERVLNSVLDIQDHFAVRNITMRVKHAKKKICLSHEDDPSLCIKPSDSPPLPSLILPLRSA